MFGTYETINRFRKGAPTLTQEELQENLLEYMGKT